VKARQPLAHKAGADSPGPFVWAVRATLILALAAYAVFIVGWLVTGRLWGDSRWPLAVLNSFPALMFLPLLPALVAALLLRRRVAWVLVAIPLVAWIALFGWRFLPRVSRAEAAEGQLRVMTFNLLSTNRDADSIVAAVNEAQPDLIALSELNPVTHSMLVKRLGSEYPYQVFERLSGAGFGNGIYSRWPLDDLGAISTGLGLRSAMADIYTPQGVVRLVSMHPWATHVGRGWQGVKAGVVRSFLDRNAQVTAICRHLDAWGNRPVIVAGDFNMSEFSDAYRCINSRLHDGYRRAGFGFGNTWPSARPASWPWNRVAWLPPLTRIDYVFHSDHWRAVDARVLKLDTGSDHRPIVVTLQPISGG
jgi:vancomycin resistance protein VanJ